MNTEDRDPRFALIDTWREEQITESLTEAHIAAAAVAFAAAPQIARAARVMRRRLQDGAARIFWAGAGTSGRLNVQAAVELGPTYAFPPDRSVILMAGGIDALMCSVEGAEDDMAAATRMCEENGLCEKDVLIATAASGRTPFTVACMRSGNAKKALTIGIANSDLTPLLEESQYAVALLTGPEPVAGSTKGKAATAQRIALEALVTAVFAKRGGICDGEMVDMQSSNEKLRARDIEIVSRICDCSEIHAQRFLHMAGGNKKIAVLLHDGGTVESAKASLELAGSDLRAARKMQAETFARQ